VTFRPGDSPTSRNPVKKGCSSGPYCCRDPYSSNPMRAGRSPGAAADCPQTSAKQPKPAQNPNAANAGPDLRLGGSCAPLCLSANHFRGRGSRSSMSLQISVQKPVSLARTNARSPIIRFIGARKGALRTAENPGRRNPSARRVPHVARFYELARQHRVWAFSRMASNTGARLPDEELIKPPQSQLPAPALHRVRAGGRR
jgi:hypothetical protein